MRRSGPSRSTPWTAPRSRSWELLTYRGRLGARPRAGGARQAAQSHIIPAWYWYADFYDAYRRGDYRGALSLRAQGQLPGQYFSHAMIAAAYGQLGEREAAGEPCGTCSRCGRTSRRSRATSSGSGLPELVEHLIDGLRKAGLEIAPAAGRDDRGRRTMAVRDARARLRGRRDRGAAVLRHEPREGPGVSLRGDGRGDHERARPRSTGSASRRGPRRSGRGRTAATCPRSPGRCRWATSSRAACGRRAAGCGSPRSSPTSRAATSSGRSASTGRPRTSSPSRTRSPPASSRR